MRNTVRAVLGVLGLYLIGRGIVELFTISWHDPSSYRDDWGGPSLLGVLAVHTGPAVVLIIAAIVSIRRRHRENSSWKGLPS